MPDELVKPELAQRAADWIAGDPDQDTRDALDRALSAGDVAELEAAVGSTLTFGTAGIRGQVGPGSGRMNAAVVIKTTGGLAAYLKSNGRAARPVVVGFDARPSSRRFAELASGVLAAAGLHVRYFPEVAPTPLVAFAAKDLRAGAAVVVTASHNPPADNGYKVYGANAAQIIPPEDGDIAAAIEATGPANAIPIVSEVFSGQHPAVQPLGDEPFSRYMREVMASRPSAQHSDLKFVYTAMHGVGGAYVSELLEMAGHTGLRPVEAQFAPDGRFPTVSFPNPEEPGALDLALDLARETGAAALIANDPDADRLAAAVEHAGEWRRLSGNELGALLGDYVLRYWSQPARPIVANSVVSSPILKRLASLHGANHTDTLTGFKWIINAALTMEERGEGTFAFGFEEALGYSIGRTVRDKDGMSAALVFIDLVAEESAAGRSVIDRLHEIWSAVGLWVSTQRSIVRTGAGGATAIAAALKSVADNPPSEVRGRRVTAVTDFRFGAEGRQPWLGAQNLIELTLDRDCRILARPSGTEPKLKIYVDLPGDPGSNPDQRHRDLEGEAELLAEAMEGVLGL